MTVLFAQSVRNALILGVILFTLQILAAPVSANSPQRLCDDAASQAASETDVPLSVLREITRVETGRLRDGALVPWPWTVELGGAGTWFEDQDSARAFVFRHFKNGVRSFDVGCFQINYKWQGHAFATIDEMFEPLANARYAVHVLTELFQELGDWSQVAQAYHARAQRHADRYSARFIWIDRRPNSQSAKHGPPQAEWQREYGSPFLKQQEESGHHGSLVPMLQPQSGSSPTALFTGG